MASFAKQRSCTATPFHQCLKSTRPCTGDSDKYKSDSDFSSNHFSLRTTSIVIMRKLMPNNKNNNNAKAKQTLFAQNFQGFGKRKARQHGVQGRSREQAGGVEGFVDL